MPKFNYDPKTQHIAAILMRYYPEHRIKITGINKVDIYVNPLNVITVFYDDLDVLHTENARVASLESHYIYGAIVASAWEAAADEQIEREIHDKVNEHWDPAHAEKDTDFFKEHYPIFHRTRRWKFKRNLALFALAVVLPIISICIYKSNPENQSDFYSETSAYSDFDDSDKAYIAFYQDSISHKYGIEEREIVIRKDSIFVNDHYELIEKEDTISKKLTDAIYSNEHEPGFNTGLAVVKINGKECIINEAGDILPFTTPDESDIYNLIYLGNNLFAVTLTNKRTNSEEYYIINNTGKTVLPEKYNSIKHITDQKFIAGSYLYSTSDLSRRFAPEIWDKILDIYNVVAIVLFCVVTISLLLIQRKKRRNGEIF